MIAAEKPARTRKTAEDRSSEILAAAKKRFAVTGFEGTSIRQIADDLGVAQGLLLYHFKNKDELWKAVMAQIFSHSAEISQEEIRQALPDNPKSQLLAGIRGFIRVCQEEPDLHRLMTMEGRSKTPRLEWLAENYLRPSHGQAIALIQDCQNQGQVRAGDPTLLYYSIIAIAGSAFSFAPEIALLSPASTPVDPQAVEEMICATLFVNP